MTKTGEWNCAPGCDYPVTSYHARRAGKILCEEIEMTQTKTICGKCVLLDNTPTFFGLLMERLNASEQATTVWYHANSHNPVREVEYATKDSGHRDSGR